MHEWRFVPNIFKGTVQAAQLFVSLCGRFACLCSCFALLSGYVWLCWALCSHYVSDAASCIFLALPCCPYALLLFSFAWVSDVSLLTLVFPRVHLLLALCTASQPPSSIPSVSLPAPSHSRPTVPACAKGGPPFLSVVFSVPGLLNYTAHANWLRRSVNTSGPINAGHGEIFSVYFSGRLRGSSLCVLLAEETSRSTCDHETASSRWVTQRTPFFFFLVFFNLYKM